MKKKSNSETSDKRQRDTDQSSVLDSISNDIKESVANSLKGVPEVKAYVTTLNKYKQHMSGKPSKLEYGVPLIVEPLTMHDVGHIVNDAFRDYLCRELPGNKRKLFNSLELKEHLSLIEDIRCAEKDVMEVQERLLRVDDKGDWIELKPRNVENYSLLCPRMFVFNANGKKGVNNTKLNHWTYILKLILIVWKTETIRQYIILCGYDVLLILYKNSFFQKTVIITNAGKKTIPFKLLTSNLWLHYDYNPRCPLAPGMNAKLIITFKCTSMEDKYELISLMTADNKKTNILVGAVNASPILHYFLECYDDMKTKDCKKLSLRKPSSVCLFECNACLVGARKTMIIKIKNVGRSSKFILVSENVWYTKSVEDVEWKRTLILGAFTITPSIFEIDFDQTIELTVVFEPRLSSFYCTRFIIVSDNSCAQEVNVFGDGQMFGARSIRLTVRSRTGCGGQGKRNSYKTT
ncbi:uncharacterized protein LOC132951388 [Metopolophium dirhodum]|uniref:uncharacterized protein LOC132951388 n=1 Tax=Metopolophium dirhodum TaxID=44670 RepID=UPI0029906D05|nr:uncharacterized protein LOC132951388 [Metopolophium dirhodum]